MKTKEEILSSLNHKSDEWHGRYCFRRSVIYEAMQLYSDQQNKELRERLAQEDEKAVFIERANAELTRLRELLGKIRNVVIGEIQTVPSWKERKQLLTEIDNALNHKP